jgi:hypothetical protein
MISDSFLSSWVRQSPDFQEIETARSEPGSLFGMASTSEPRTRSRGLGTQPAAQDGIDGLQGSAELAAIAFGQVMTARQAFLERGAQAVKGVIGEPVQG